MIKKLIYNFIIKNYLKNNYLKFKEYSITNISLTHFKIEYKNTVYNLKVIKELNEYYLYLKPYNTSYFKTKISTKNLNFKIDMTLFAIKENEELYEYKKCKKTKKNTRTPCKKGSE